MKSAPLGTDRLEPQGKVNPGKWAVARSIGIVRALPAWAMIEQV